MRTKRYVILPVEYHREEDGRWVAECKKLDISTYADTFERVVEEIGEAIALYLNTLEDVGERERFFREHNIRIFRTPTPKLQVTIDRPDVCVKPYVHQLQPAGAY